MPIQVQHTFRVSRANITQIIVFIME